MFITLVCFSGYEQNKMQLLKLLCSEIVRIQAHNSNDQVSCFQSFTRNKKQEHKNSSMSYVLLKFVETKKGV